MKIQITMDFTDFKKPEVKKQSDFKSNKKKKIVIVIDNHGDTRN